MQELVKEYLDELNKRQKKSRKISIAVILLVVIVVGSVTGILTQYGVAMTGKAKCGQEEHQHGEECYEDRLVCGLTEQEGHIHTAECSNPKELVCGFEESEGHTHTQECQMPKELVCGLEESEEHEHTEECYFVPEGFACGLEESEGHQHTDACYSVPEGFVCGLEEGEGHSHIEECYQNELVCEKAEHTHTDVCYTDAAADVEDASVWDRQYASVQWQGIWGDDLVTAAQMQLGYQESSDNYIILEDKSHKGYTRYGQFAGDPYADWDAAFVNFCLHYAGVRASGLFPDVTDTARWCDEFIKIKEENGAYITPSGNYIPKAGDLIFFQKEGEETASQMGIVSSYEAETATVRAIEGNSGNEVRENTYNVADSHIVSYLNISELETAVKGTETAPDQNAAVTPAEPGAKETETPQRIMTAEGADYTVTVSFTAEANIPKDAVLDVREIVRGSEEYQEYYRQSLDAMQVEEIGFARYFDVTFLLDDTEIEPSAPVDVKIRYKNRIDMEEDANGNAVHFTKDKTEVLDAGIDQEENSFSFTQNSFSVVGTVVANGSSSYFYKGGIPENLDGKTFLLETSVGTDRIFLTGSSAVNAGQVNGLAGSEAKDIVSVENPQEENLWTFHKVNASAYSIQNVAAGTYLTIDQQNVTLQDTACALTVETDSDMITIRKGKYFLDAGEKSCIVASGKKEGELQSHHKFRLFGMGKDYTLLAEGEDYRITLHLSALDGLLDDVVFTAEEITGEKSEEYAKKAKEALGFEEVGFQRFFHLGFDKEIPEDLVHILSVSIQYKGNAEGFDINGAGGVVQFKGSSEMVVSAKTEEAETENEDVGEEVLSARFNGRERSISAEISELSDLGTVMLASEGETYLRQDIAGCDDLDQKTFLITCIEGSKKGVMGSQPKAVGPNSGLEGFSFAGGDMINRTDGMALWRFEKQNDYGMYGTFTVKLEGTDQYLNLNNGSLSLGGRQELRGFFQAGPIVMNNDSGAVSYDEWEGAFYGGGFSALTLYGKGDEPDGSDLELKVESADLAGTPIQETTQPQQIPDQSSVFFKKSRPYIIFDGTQIGLVKSAQGTEKSYQYERAQIVYQDPASGRKTVRGITEANITYLPNERYEITFSGPRLEGNGISSIATFDQDTIKNVTVQYGYRAYKNSPLDVVPSLDTSNKFSIRMIDYPQKQFSGYDWTETNKEVKPGILNSYLNSDGYPSFRSTIVTSQIYPGATSLNSYFANAKDANKLFVTETYENSGYYEFDSQENGASFDEKTGNFIIYQQLTTPSDSDGGLARNRLYGKGQFLPYNTFDNERKIANINNIYTAQAGDLSPDDERYGDDLYLPDQETNYNFGMELSAEFYQMQNGKINRNPMRYEFTGDDDLWVYVDGVLILDMGGAHDARSGYIDFSTGEVYVQSGTGGGGTTKKLYDLFKAARDEAEAGGASQEVISALNKKLEDSQWKTLENGNKIFADYTKHSFKMWYMERGGGASNLRVRFNLPVIPSGEVQIEKQLEGSDQGNYVNTPFDFQVYLQPILDLGAGQEDKFDDAAEPKDYKLLSTELLSQGRTDAEAFILRTNGREEKITIPSEEEDQGIFHIKPGEKLILRGLKVNRKYFVRELNLKADEYSNVKVDQIVVEEEDSEGSGTRGNGIQVSEDKTWADTDVKTVSERAYIVFKNECSRENRNLLKIKKEMNGGSSGDDTYTFQVWLGNQAGQMELYEGKYYLVNKDGYYYSEQSGKLILSSCNDAPDQINENTPSLMTKEGSPGIIAGISPDDTVIIRNLVKDTKFYVEEVHPGLQYEDPVYELQAGTYQPPQAGIPLVTADLPHDSDEESGKKTEMGSIQLGTDAVVTVKNSKLGNRTWQIVKKSSTEGGPYLGGAVFELSATGLPEGESRVYYGKSVDKTGEIQWYQERNCTTGLQISDLVTGSYQFREIAAVKGYSLSGEIWEIEIKPRNGISIAGQRPKTETVKGSAIDGSQDIEKLVYTFTNKPMYELPNSGGSGIYWYLIGGMLFMMAGALILYKNKCREVRGS